MHQLSQLSQLSVTPLSTQLHTERSSMTPSDAVLTSHTLSLSALLEVTRTRARTHAHTHVHTRTRTRTPLRPVSLSDVTHSQLYTDLSSMTPWLTVLTRARIFSDSAGRSRSPYSDPNLSGCQGAGSVG